MAGFRPRLIAGLLLLVALAAPGCTRDTATAGDAQPPAATQEAHAAETLALRVKQGDQFTYHSQVKTTVKAEDQTGASVPLPPQQSGGVMDYDMVITFDKIEGDLAAVRYELKGLAPGVDDLQLTMTLNTRTGEVSAVSGLTDLGLGADVQNMMQEQMNKIIKESFTQFSPERRGIGSTWTTETMLPIPLPGMQNKSAMRVTTTYEANEEKDGIPVAKLTYKGNGPIDLEAGDDKVQIALKGDSEVTGVQWVDRRNGMLYRNESRAVVRITVTMKGTAPGQNTQVTMESTAEATSQLNK